MIYTYKKQGHLKNNNKKKDIRKTKNNAYKER